MQKIIKKFQIIKHFINKEFNLECGIYYIETLKEKEYIVQTGEDYKVISHIVGKGTVLDRVKSNIIAEIKDRIKEEE